MDTTSPSFGVRVRAAAKARGLLLHQLGNQLGISKQAVSDLVAERSMGIRRREALEHILQVPYEWLVNGTGPVDAKVLQCLDEIKASKDSHDEPSADIPQDIKDFLDLIQGLISSLRDSKVNDPAKYHKLKGLASFNSTDQLIFSSSDPKIALRFGPVYLWKQIWMAFQQPNSLSGDEFENRLSAARRWHRHSRTSSRPLHQGTSRLKMPLDVFETIRRSLLSIRDQRRIFHNNEADITKALSFIWEELLNSNIPEFLRTPLENQRRQDLSAGDSVANTNNRPRKVLSEGSAIDQRGRKTSDGMTDADNQSDQIILNNQLASQQD